MTFRYLSIAQRMLLASTLIMLTALPLTGVMLSWNFKSAVNTAFDERLRSLLNVVLASVNYDPVTDQLVVNRELGDSRFDRVFSGWYWQISDLGDRVLTSRSLWDQRLPVSPGEGVRISSVPGPSGEHLRKLEREIRLPKLPEPLYVSVAASTREIASEIARFQQLLWSSLAVLGGFLVIAIWLQIRWGLVPLRRLSHHLRQVEQGDRQALGTELPDELKQLAVAINTVLARDEALIKRGRDAAGNLAHALKTPLSVMKTLSGRLGKAEREAIDDELRRMDEAVKHHLARASAAGPMAIRQGVDARAALKPIIEAIIALGARRGVKVIADDLAPVKVAVDPKDLQEMVGNLLENAVNWATSTVTIVVGVKDRRVVLEIVDDGPGMSKEDCQRAVTRGSRLDEKQPGWGLGLSIVNDLVGLYQGALVFENLDTGGFKVQLAFPVH